MNNKTKTVFFFLLICLIILTGCDPIYPPGKLKVEKLPVLSVGDHVEINIVYPDDGLIVDGWKNQTVEIIEGSDVIAISGLTITALKPGTALIKVSATTVISDELLSQGYEERQYSTYVDIKVK